MLAARESTSAPSMKDEVITAALAVSGFALTLAFVSWRNGALEFSGAAGQVSPAVEAAAPNPESIRIASRDGGVWAGNPFVAGTGSPDVPPQQDTASQKLPLPATPADIPAVAPPDVVDPPGPPSYESQVDRDEQENHASRIK
jgi:hypothetical protein